MLEKPVAPACERNQQPILEKIAAILSDSGRVLEIGSGTGQHAVYFAEALPHIEWHTSDLASNHAGIHLWLEDSGLSNLKPPLMLDVAQSWPVEEPYDVIFTANSLHIMSWAHVEAFFQGVGQHLAASGTLIIYGPFNYGGEYVSVSNAEFDQWLKSRDSQSAIRDFEAITALAEAAGLGLEADHAMPANNRLLVFRR